MRSVLRPLCLAAGLVVLVSLFTSGAAAFAGVAEDLRVEMVYWPLVTDGAEHRRVSYPLEAGDLHLLADTPAVLEVREGEVSYWPITREYLVDYGSSVVDADDFVEGHFEITDAAGTITLSDQVEYIEWYPDGVTQLGSEIVTGDEAQRVYDRYVEDSSAAFDAAQEYNRLVAEQQRIMELWLEAAAENPDDPPPAPDLEVITPPEPYRSYASEPRTATVVSLPSGNYTVRLVDEDGNVVEGTERRIVSFGPLSHGTGYVLIPEDRWTQPTPNHDPREAIYTTMDEEDLFLLSVPVDEYSAVNYARLFRPQLIDPPAANATIWVPRPALGESGQVLAASRMDGNQDLVPERLYRVEQTPGSNRGYTIEELDPASDLAPDFSAMRLTEPSRVRDVWLDQSGGTVPGSHRTVREFRLSNDLLLFVIAVLPFVVAIALGVGRRRRSSYSGGQ